MRRVNPRRDALEYGILMTLGTAMVGAMGLMLFAEKPKDRKLDLDKPLDFQQLWKEVQSIRYRESGSNKSNIKDNAK